ncbi:PAS/PAC sensor signal transduction histidine kinase [Oryzisolibacter propanilivorax]|uniref:histidine kinase n=1 Tax=Oryzisolibacter propanilivorax TaxID=1527607 RepID=A0A1G9Q7J0_9BURK|nr:ATP-binding protein [Oryzisolibacter propanilivorax]SDM07008.1 PAS/PAC sensor signal transduction histidine kinase [Oryzisolibacter propanilivorax]
MSRSVLLLLPRLPPRWVGLARRGLGAWRRWSLWVLLGALVAGVLVTLVWLAGRYEASQVQDRLDRDAAEAVADLRTALLRDVHELRALSSPTGTPLAWEGEASELLSRRHALARLEWRDAQLHVRLQALSPWHGMPARGKERDGAHSETGLACNNARRLMGPSYASSYFQPLPIGVGAEMMELCLPLIDGGRVQGFVVATYVLQSLLTEVVAPQLRHGQEVSFTEADGTRLALLAGQRRGSRVFTARQLFDLPGNALVLRMDGWHAAPSVFPNVLTALVTAMSIALVSVVLVLVRDMRRRLRAERELAEALALRKAMENSLVTGLRARDLQGQVTYVNPAFCAMVGFGAAELVGCSFPPPYWPPERREDYSRLQHARLSRQASPPAQGYESLFMRRDGTRFPVMVYEAPLIDAKGAHTGWMGSILDVSEQRRAEELSRTTHERLQATARLATVGEMASLLSHELNQPLAAIASYASGSLNLLQTPDGAPPAAQDLADVQEALQRIAAQAGRAGRVIKSVHDFVRRRARTREAVAPQELLEAVLPIVRLQARKLQVEVEVEVEDGLPPALCDRTMVEQVLLNLTRNAMQAMEGQAQDASAASPLLRLRVRRAAGGAAPRWLEFGVADNGSGIPAEVAQRLFTPFFTTRAEGMGLGLSLCRTVVEQHGGHLAHAPGAGRGTFFVFTLPAAPVADASFPTT